MDNGLAWFGFWIFMTVFVVCEAWLYSKGHDTFFFEHKTEAEKQIRDRQTGSNPQPPANPPGDNL